MKTNMKDDLEDIPMAYPWYVVLAIMGDCSRSGGFAFDCFSSLKVYGSNGSYPAKFASIAACNSRYILAS
jgi:hypothetical protein